jgi:hypothetical protein
MIRRGLVSSPLMMVLMSFLFINRRSRLTVSVVLLKESLLSIRLNLITMDDLRLLMLLDLMVLMFKEPDAAVVAAAVVMSVVVEVMEVEVMVVEVVAMEVEEVEAAMVVAEEAMVEVDVEVDVVEAAVAAITVVNLDTWLGIAAAVEAVEEVVVGTVEAVEEVAAAVEAATTVESLVTLPEIAQPVLVRSLYALLFMSKVWVI